MHLKRLELQGFKTFAQKTGLEFVLDTQARRGITAVVGPNGSGKSNIADALRWVMGEQSLKLLRGKKSEDVIFSGTTSRARSGFAEVTMMLERDVADAPSEDIPWQEIAVTRRLYRDGQSVYEINRQSARLQDVVMLLAHAGVGQRTYSVIGQGMVDAVLVATPSERKEFFDEAFGLKTFQLKRLSAMTKLDQARENMKQTELLLHEIAPRLTSLERQVKRLQDRESLEEKLHTMERIWYGQSWKDIRSGLEALRARLDTQQSHQSLQEAEAKHLESELDTLERATPPSQGFRELRQEWEKLSQERADLKERESTLATQRAVAAVRAEKPWSPLPLTKIIASVELFSHTLGSIELALQEKMVDAVQVRTFVKELRRMSDELMGTLQRPAPAPEPDTILDNEQEVKQKTTVDEIEAALASVAKKMERVEARMEGWNQQEESKRKEVFALQHRLNQKRRDVQAAGLLLSETQVECARLETRKDAFMTELRHHAPSLEGELDAIASSDAASPPTDPAQLQRLRSQLEWIGGIDPEIVTEHSATKTRFNELTSQMTDLQTSMHHLAAVIEELDSTIQERSETAFHRLNKEFGMAFQTLFGGGEAKIIELHAEPTTDESEETIVSEDEDAIAGIDVQATPPGKRNKTVALLSGGERALTSIALICAIMATNPSPFVVLDEVDAALDEANSRKFAEIIASLAERTQFIVVTHNRATMQQAHVLYGVTMGDDGVSQILSVKLDEIEKLKKKK